MQYKTQASQAQLKAQQEAEARKRVEAEAQAVAQARMHEKPRVSKGPLNKAEQRKSFRQGSTMLRPAGNAQCVCAYALPALHSGLPSRANCTCQPVAETDNCYISGFALQNEYASGGLDASYSGSQAAFSAAYGGQAYQASGLGAPGQDAYGANALYSQGFAAASQVCMKQHLKQSPQQFVWAILSMQTICSPYLACAIMVLQNIAREV